LRFGRVTSFDARRGWGTVSEWEGVAFEFHATAIVDGSRQIEPGVYVAFVVVPGHRGRYEARELTGAVRVVQGVRTLGSPPRAGIAAGEDLERGIDPGPVSRGQQVE
jgi:cold shock CspA family protein